MQTRMITCPHCGAANSERKTECYECRKALRTPGEAAALRKAEAPKTPQRALLPDEQLAARAPANPAAERKTYRAPGIIGVTLRQRVQIYRQLHSLLKAGIPIGLAFNYLEANVAKYLRPMVHDIGECAQQGIPVSTSMARYHSVFPEWEVNLVRAAEKAGTLPDAMLNISERLEAEMELRYQLRSKLLPLQGTALMFILTILIVMSASQIAGQISNVVPVLTNVGFRFLGIVTAIILFINAWRFWVRSPRGARVSQAIVSRLFLIGPIIQNQMRYRFVQVLGAMWKAGVSPLESLECAARASNNPYLIHRIAEQMNRFGEGATLSEILAATKAFPDEILYMVRSGEESGQVAESLERVSEYIRIELEAQVKTLPARVQFVMYLVIGIAVGWLVISFWTHYFNNLLTFMQ